MTGDCRRIGRLQSVIVVASTCSLWVVACVPIEGYPKDPENTDATLTALQPFFDGTAEKEYLAAVGDAARTPIRDEIILRRLRGYDIEFGNFQRQLYGQSNTVTLGSDLIGLILGGLTATTGNATTKAALGAASTGIIGANAAINRDLYYQKTIPALITQMEANRLKAKLPIVQGMTQPDSKYSLMQAYIDLDSYKNAGGIPSAISTITQNAATDKEVAQDSITFVRTSAYVSELPDIQAVQALLKTLSSDQQFVALAKAMQPYLATRPPQIQQLVKIIDPNNARLTGDALKAKEVINAWVGEEDMTAVNKKQWVDAITTVSK
jgi:hypothetical protein